jgi:hypothetical protein
MDDQVHLFDSSPEGTGRETRPKKRRGCFFYGCLTVNLVILVVICGLFLLFRFGRTTVTPIVKEFLAAAESGNYDHAYAMCGDDWKQVVSREDFPEFFKLIHDTLGKRNSLSMRGINLQTTPAGTFARASFGANYDKGGDIEIIFTLKKDGEVWQILGMHCNSPLLMAALKCPKCGANNTIGAKFCAKCGDPLRAQQVNVPVEKVDEAK